ncbi:MAG: VOC family protein [Candidatus Kapaibacterium sp.]
MIEFGRIVVLVKDYENALRFYQNALGCSVIYDGKTDDGKRLLHLGFGLTDKAGLWLMKAENDEQEKLIGNQAGNQPFLVLYTDELDIYKKKFAENRVKILKEPNSGEDYKFMHFEDLYGNEIVLVEMEK